MTLYEPYITYIAVIGKFPLYRSVIRLVPEKYLYFNMDQPSRNMLSNDQLAELQQAFNEFDMDGDHFISTKELGWAMRAMGMNPTEAEILQLINTVFNIAS